MSIFIFSYANIDTLMFLQHPHPYLLFLGCCLPSKKKAKKTKAAKKKTCQLPKRDPLFSRRENAPIQIFSEWSGQIPLLFAYQYLPGPLPPKCFSSLLLSDQMAGHVPADSAFLAEGLIYHSLRLALHPQNFNTIYQSTARWNQDEGRWN